MQAAAYNGARTVSTFEVLFEFIHLNITRDVFQRGHNSKSSAPRIIIEILEELQMTFWNSSGNLAKTFLQTMTKLLISFQCLFQYLHKQLYA